MMAKRTPPDCICDGEAPRCHVCLVASTVAVYRGLGDKFSIGRLKRSIPQLSGREAALMTEAMRYIERRHY